MLVLTRKATDSIVINDDVVVTILEIGPTTVRLGITANKAVPVYREEIYEIAAADPAAEQPAQARNFVSRWASGSY